MKCSTASLACHMHVSPIVGFKRMQVPIQTVVCRSVTSMHSRIKSMLNLPDQLSSFQPSVFSQRQSSVISKEAITKHRCGRPRAEMPAEGTGAGNKIREKEGVQQK